MASGYYPISKFKNKDYDLLLQAMKNIDEARQSIGIAEDQYDNAADDGAYAYRLVLAEQLINECIQ